MNTELPYCFKSWWGEGSEEAAMENGEEDMGIRYYRGKQKFTE